MSLSVSWFAALPVATFGVSWLAPNLVFPPPPACKPGSPELLHLCAKASQRGFSFSILVVAIVIGLALTVFTPPGNMGLVTPTARAVYALQLEVAPLVFYMICILRVAMARSKDTNAVLGERVGVSASVEMASRVLQNTTEQLLLGMFSILALSTVLDPWQCAALPALVALWVCGRIVFVMGYTATNPLARELGFDLTILTSMVALGWFVAQSTLLKEMYANIPFYLQ